jgi:gas vesicle protein GvpA/GvpJ/GvpM family
MSDVSRAGSSRAETRSSGGLSDRPAYGPAPSNLADVLERVLDKGIVIAGDIKVNLLDIELLTVKIRLLVVSVDKAAELGIDWWRHDPMLSSSAQDPELADENERLRARVRELEGASKGERR